MPRLLTITLYLPLFLCEEGRSKLEYHGLDRVVYHCVHKHPAMERLEQWLITGENEVEPHVGPEPGLCDCLARSCHCRQGHLDAIVWHGWQEMRS